MIIDPVDEVATSCDVLYDHDIVKKSLYLVESADGGRNVTECGFTGKYIVMYPNSHTFFNQLFKILTLE